MKIIFIVVLLLILILIMIYSYCICDKKEYKSQSTILILMDQLIAWHRLPEDLLVKLKGYQAFKKISIEYTNIFNNRQPCSPSRSSFFTSKINLGIQDDINEDYQFLFVPFVNPTVNTIGKIYKNNGYITAYYGKNHIDARLYDEYIDIPVFGLNTRGSMKSYGFDIFNTYGDTAKMAGIIGDNREFQSIMPFFSEEYDYYDGTNKLSGCLPFLKARYIDKKPFHLQYQIANPHDTMQFYQNTSQKPSLFQFQLTYPFIKEQSNIEGYYNPYIYDVNFKDAFVKHTSLTTNYFERTFEEYSSNSNSLPFKNSLFNDYALNPKYNSIFPFLAGSNVGLKNYFSLANDEDDIKSHKNLVNNYYGLVIEADMYIYRIYKYLEETDQLKDVSVIISSDHGDEMTSHGLKEKGFPFNNSTNVSFMVYSPKLLNPGTKSDVLGSLLDLNPTLQYLSNIKDETGFMGESLIEKNINGKLVPRFKDIPVLNIQNSTMVFFISYKGWKDWISIQTEETINKCISIPNNMFEFQYCFIMTIKIINGIKYKFCRFFNVLALYKYNLKNNDKLKDKIFDNLSGEFDMLPEKFSFDEGYDIIKNLPESYIEKYMIFIHNSIIKIIESLFIIPGFGESYADLVKDKNYSFMCYDETNDDDEIYNLADPNYKERHNEDLFNELNEQIDHDIIKYNMKNFYFISPIEALKPKN